MLLRGGCMAELTVLSTSLKLTLSLHNESEISETSLVVLNVLSATKNSSGSQPPWVLYGSLCTKNSLQEECEAGAFTPNITSLRRATRG